MSQPAELPPPDQAAICRMGSVIAAPPPREVPSLQAQQANPARWMFERLATYIRQFEARLDDDHEIGARLVSFGANLTFHIEDMGYFGPDMIVFYGKNDKGEPVQLVQHTSQLSVLLVAVRKQDARPRRIGFILDEKEPAQVQLVPDPAQATGPGLDPAPADRAPGAFPPAP